MDEQLYPGEEDLVYEEELLRNPFTLKLWWRYLVAKRDAPWEKRAIIYERAVKALPGSYKLWHAYLTEKMELVRGLPITNSRYENLNSTFERALVTMHKMPRIWLMYLQILTEQKFLTRARRTFDRALRSLPVTQHDRIWEPYLQFVSQRGIPVETSLRVYRRYLKFDPTHIEDFIQFLLDSELWQKAAETLVGVLNDPGFCSVKGKTKHQMWLELCDLLTQHATEVFGIWADAIIRDGIRKFSDEVGRLWTSLAEYYIRGGRFEKVEKPTKTDYNRCGRFEKAAKQTKRDEKDYAKNFELMRAMHWRGRMEKVRDIYEEGMMAVVTVRDFSIIFDAYTQFEESMVAAGFSNEENGQNEENMGGYFGESRTSELQNDVDRQLDEEENEQNEENLGEIFGKSRANELQNDEDRQVYNIKAGHWLTDVKDNDLIDLRMARLEDIDNMDNIRAGHWLTDVNDNGLIDLRLLRLENLINRRPELVSSVMLRQNPNNVHEWHKRVKLFKENPTKQILTFTEAVKTVDPMKAVGKPHTLWVSFARLYENHKDVANARVIFEKAVQVNYKTVDDLASVWCDWAEMELRNKNLKRALELMRRATAEPSVEVKRRVAADGNQPVQMKLHKSLKIWTLYVDLEECLGTLDSARAVYERILDLKIATPQIVMNYAHLLEENKYFEDAFKVYERGVKIFKYPHVKDIWVIYLSKFVNRYKGTKLERARDLFKQAVEKAPAENVKSLYLQHAKFEEDYGLARNVIEVYDRAAKAVPDNEKIEIYDLYISCAAENFGFTKTREIYKLAIEDPGLPDKYLKVMCMNFAEMERKLGEIDRARSIYIYISQLTDPRSDPEFWSKWHEFEIKHGNEDTFGEMLRIRRSVQASHSQTHFMFPENLMQRDQGLLNLDETVDKIKSKSLQEDRMAVLEKQLPPAAASSVAAKDGMRRLAFVSADVESHARVVGTAVGVRISANPEDIELEESDAEEADEKVEVSQKDIPAAVFGELAGKLKINDKEDVDRKRKELKESMGALERIKRRRQ